MTKPSQTTGWEVGDEMYGVFLDDGKMLWVTKAESDEHHKSRPPAERKTIVSVSAIQSSR